MNEGYPLPSASSLRDDSPPDSLAQAKDESKSTPIVIYNDGVSSSSSESPKSSTPANNKVSGITNPVFHDVNEDLAATLNGLRFKAELVQALDDAIIASDGDFRIQIFNPGAESMYGVKAKDILGTDINDFLRKHTVDPIDLKEAVRLFLHQQSWSGRVQQFGAKNAILDVDYSVSALFNGNDRVAGAVLVARDVTRVLKAERIARERTAFATSVLESLPGRTCILDSQGVIIATNKRYREEGPAGAGESTGPDIGTDYTIWASKAYNPETGEEISQIASGASTTNYRNEFATVRRRKRTWTEILVVPLSTEEGGAVITHLDITLRKQAEATLTRRATHDPLTSLPNRVLLTDRLTQALARAGRSGNFVGVLFCDLDGFRDVNNTHGHLAGDKLLATIAKRLRAVCRSSDTVARVSGDEFVIVLEDVQGEQEIEEVSRRVIDALTEPVLIDDHTLETGTSIGLVMSPGVSRAGIKTVESLIRDADAAMYAAKERGRGQFAWFSPEMRERTHERPAFVRVFDKLIGRS